MANAIAFGRLYATETMIKTQVFKMQIFSPAALLQRIIPEHEYRVKWDKWCDHLHAEICRSRIPVQPFGEEKFPDILDVETQKPSN